jgi:DNA-binding transcriptional regulator YiaG
MNLPQYRKKSGGMSQTAAAVWFGVARETLSRWETGKQIPSRQHQEQIERLTKGKVRPRDWMNGNSRER